MRVVSYLNTTHEEVEARKYNIWFGVSLGNKHFSKENLETYILWLVAHVKEHLLIVVADSIHAINLEVLNAYSKERSAAVALRRGAEKADEIKEIILRLPTADQQKVTLLSWSEVVQLKPKEYTELLFGAYKTDLGFKDFILSIVKENPKVNRTELTSAQYDHLAEYILRELPVYINGVTYEGKKHLLQPYPGLGRIDRLIMGLQDGTLFPEIAAKMPIVDKISIIEAYAD